ncbi:MAG: DNA primase [Candidatus Methylomirabilia bacterium]
MASGFSPTLLDEIRSRVDVVDLIGQFVNLRRAGENWKGLCPFHAEKTPSFTVNPKKGIFHCFGCGVGGDAFGFVIRQDRLSFPEAVKALARRAGVDLPAQSRREGEGPREALYGAMGLAADFYTEALWSRPEGEQVRRYLDHRGIDPLAAKRFGLGYAREGWDHLLTFMRSSGVSEDVLVQAGLVLARQTGTGFYDRFRGRLMFPIRDVQGRSVAFGGRAIGTEEPKYLNSPETPLYVKGQTLYAMDLAREAIREKNRAVIVEGYVDCLMAHQHGFVETVAALGTAFTGAQLALLRRHCDEVITFFDADAAGRKATERAEEFLEPTAASLAWAVNRSGGFEEGTALSLKVALLPGGHDPDSLLRTEGAAGFGERLGEARSLLAFVMDRVLAEEHSGSPKGRATAFARIALILSKATGSQEASELSRYAALKLGVDPTELWIEAQRLHGAFKKSPAPPRASEAQPEVTPMPVFEQDLLHLMATNEQARDALLPMLETEDLSHALSQELLETLRRHRGLAPEQIVSLAESEDCRGALSRFLITQPRWDYSVEAAKQWAERRQRIRRVRDLARAITTPGSDTDLTEQLQRLYAEAGIHRLSQGQHPEHTQGA